MKPLDVEDPHSEGRIDPPAKLLVHIRRLT
jgi:hypothetical protein